MIATGLGFAFRANGNPEHQNPLHTHRTGYPETMLRTRRTDKPSSCAICRAIAPSARRLRIRWLRSSRSAVDISGMETWQPPHCETRCRYRPTSPIAEARHCSGSGFLGTTTCSPPKRSARRRAAKVPRRSLSSVQDRGGRGSSAPSLAGEQYDVAVPADPATTPPESPLPLSPADMDHCSNPSWAPATDAWGTEGTSESRAPVTASALGSSKSLRAAGPPRRNRP